MVGVVSKSLSFWFWGGLLGCARLTMQLWRGRAECLPLTEVHRDESRRALNAGSQEEGRACMWGFALKLRGVAQVETGMHILCVGINGLRLQ